MCNIDNKLKYSTIMNEHKTLHPNNTVQQRNSKGLNLSHPQLFRWLSVFFILFESVSVNADVIQKFSSRSLWFNLQTVADPLFLFSALVNRHKKSRARSRIRRVRIMLVESVQLWAITAYELLLWVRSSVVLRWFNILLSFLHWHVTLDW